MSGVIFDNLKAQLSPKDELDKRLHQNIIFRLSEQENLGLIEEKATPVTITRFSYLDENEIKPYLTRQDMIDAILKNDIVIDYFTEDSILKPSLSLTRPNLQLRDNIIEYEVKSGDTVSAIAQLFNLNVKTILWANNLTVLSYLRPGDKLKILPVDGLLHTTSKNDQIATIAKKYQADADKIMAANKLVSAADLQIGQILIIPDGIKPAPKVVPTPVKTYTKDSVAAVAVAPTSKYEPAKTSTSKLQWPTTGHRITQYYSWSHTGLDIGGGIGVPIYAAEDGAVRIAQGGWNGGYGTYIIVTHDNGTETIYGHLSKLFVRKGDKIVRGQVIGAMGSTGRSTGPHLHFEVRLSGQRVNPLRYIQ